MHIKIDKLRCSKIRAYFSQVLYNLICSWNSGTGSFISDNKALSSKVTKENGYLTLTTNNQYTNDFNFVSIAASHQRKQQQKVLLVIAVKSSNVKHMVSLNETKKM